MKPFTKRLLLLPLLLSLAFIFTACPEDKCPDGVNAVVKDYTGLSGCHWVLELEDGEKLEPVNLHELDFEPEDGMPVRVEYTEAQQMMSICMVGKMVEIQCITRRQ